MAGNNSMFTLKPEQQQQTSSRAERTLDGREVVYETPDERQERLRMERFAEMIKSCLREVLDERAEEAAKKRKVSIF
jgi:hypothetical protein